MTRDEAIGMIIYASDPVMAASAAFRAIKDFSDLEMGDGDTAREIAAAWLSKFEKTGQ
jgi:hypothetical protein